MNKNYLCAYGIFNEEFEFQKPTATKHTYGDCKLHFINNIEYYNQKYKGRREPVSKNSFQSL